MEIKNTFPELSQIIFDTYLALISNLNFRYDIGYSGERYPGPKNSQQRKDVLNSIGIPIKGAKGEWIRGQWDAKKAGNNIRLAKKRLEKK